MQVVILAGGMGTRLQEETQTRPKPMVEIGGKPILWHIMKHYAHHGFKDFHIALGYLGDVIKEYFFHRCSLGTNLTIDFATGTIEREGDDTEDWMVKLIDTGMHALTGDRVRKLRESLGNKPFMVTYGDGVSDVDLTRLLQFHRERGLLATVTAVRPPARFGGLNLDGDTVLSFTEKPTAGEGWINGGFFVFEPEVFQYLDRESCSLESDALEELAADGQLAAFRHDGFWQCMDTLRDKHYLEQLWQTGQAPWLPFATERQTQPVDCVSFSQPPALGLKRVA